MTAENNDRVKSQTDNRQSAMLYAYAIVEKL